MRGLVCSVEEHGGSGDSGCADNEVQSSLAARVAFGLWLGFVSSGSSDGCNRGLGDGLFHQLDWLALK